MVRIQISTRKGHTLKKQNIVSNFKDENTQWVIGKQKCIFFFNFIYLFIYLFIYCKTSLGLGVKRCCNQHLGGNAFQSV